MKFIIKHYLLVFQILFLTFALKNLFLFSYLVYADDPINSSSLTRAPDSIPGVDQIYTQDKFAEIQLSTYGMCENVAALSGTEGVGTVGGPISFAWSAPLEIFFDITQRVCSERKQPSETALILYPFGARLLLGYCCPNPIPKPSASPSPSPSPSCTPPTPKSIFETSGFKLDKDKKKYAPLAARCCQVTFKIF